MLIHEDEVLGYSPLDALKRAMRIWEDAIWLETVDRPVSGVRQNMPRTCRKCRHSRKGYCEVFGDWWYIPLISDCLFADVVYEHE